MRSEKDFDLLVIGEINPDLVLRGGDVVPAFGQTEKLVEQAELTIGSSAAITACGAARLGLSVAFIGLTGDDEFGRFMLRRMEERGIDVSACVVADHTATGISVILSAGDDRAIMTYAGAIPLLQFEQIDQSQVGRARHLHLSSYFLLDALRPALPQLFASARSQGATVSLDTNWDPAGEWNLSRVLSHVDLFLPNKSEVLRLSGQTDIERGLDILANQIPTLAVKLGAAGGMARQGSERVSAPSLPVQVVDTTGAGDSFNAGFLYGFLHNYSLYETLRLACACGSLSTRSAGGTDAQPTLAEAQDALQQRNPKV